MRQDNKALVLGASGGIGGAMARALRARGWTVAAMARRAQPDGPADGPTTWMIGDAMNRADVIRAAEGASLIVHAVNPPHHRDWDKLVLPMLDNTIAAAAATGARILLPGTVYNYGPDVWPDLRESSPQNPTTRKGAIRVEMEARLRRAAQAGTPSLIVRAGDFFGPKARNTWFSEAVVKPGRPVASIVMPGRPGVGHQWAYLPDVAETMMRLVDRSQELGPFETFHMDGHWDPDGTVLAAAIRQATGRPDLKVRRFPWWAVTLASPVVPLFREMREMRYLWRNPIRLDNARLLAVLGDEPRTALDQAVQATLAGLGCLPGIAR